MHKKDDDMAKENATSSKEGIEKMLNRHLLYAVDEGRDNKIERKLDADYFDALTPVKDKAGIELDMHENDLPKVSTIRRNVDWAVGYIDNRKQNIRILPHGFGDERLKAWADYRQFQYHAIWKACKAKRKMTKVLQDAGITGEGIGRVKNMMIDKASNL